MRFFRRFEMPNELMQKFNILEGLAFWNVNFRPRRAPKTKQILREYGIFAHMKARLYRETQYDRENHQKKLQNLVKNKNRKACTKNKA